MNMIKLSVILFTSVVFTSQVMAGAKSSDAYFVKVDSETTTQNDSSPTPNNNTKKANTTSTSGAATGKRQHKPFTATKRLDKASPLLQDSTTGVHKTSDVTLKRGVTE